MDFRYGEAEEGDVMKREQVEELCNALVQNGNIVKAKLFSEHDAGQREEITLKETQIIQLTEQCAKTQGEREYYKRELDQNHKKVAQQREELAQLQHAYQLLADAHEEKAKEIRRLDEQLTEANKQIQVVSRSWQEASHNVGLAKTEITRLRDILRLFVNAVGEECRLDHHGYCQAHSLSDPCEVKLAKQALTQEPT